MSEHTLIERAGKGDLQAFRAIVDEHKMNVFRLAFDLTGSRQDAEDVSQEVFMKAYSSLAQFRGDAKLSTWLYRITVNACHDHRSRKSWNSMKPTDEFDDQKSEPMFHQHARHNPETVAEAGVMQRHIARALDALTPRERAIFVLRHYDELSLKEIASVLKISEGTVKSMLFRALQRLQKELKFYRPDIGLEESR